MRTTSLIVSTLFFVLISSFTHAQTTQDILDKANENKERRDRNNGEGSFRSSSSSSDDGLEFDDDSSFGVQIFLEGMYYLVKGVVIVQQLALESEIDNNINRISSLELAGQYGAIPTNYRLYTLILS